MPDMTPTQVKALDTLIKDFGPADSVVGGKQGLDVAFPNGNIYRIGTRGKIKVLGQELTETSGVVPSPPEDDEQGTTDGRGTPNGARQEPASTEPSTPAQLAGSDQDEQYRALTLADDRQIAADLQGQAVSAVLYSFQQGGQRVTDVSWKGVHEAIRIVNTRGYGKVGIVKGSAQFSETTIAVKVKDGEEEVPAITVRVEAEDTKNGGLYVGSATQPMKTVSKGKLRPDPFAESKALSKAQRNALRPFIPVEAIEEIKALFHGEGHVEYIPGTGREVDDPEKPAALDDEKAQKLIAEADNLYDQYKRADPNWTANMPPRKFYLFKQDSWHSHKRLGDFVKFMREQLKEAKGE